MKINSQNYINTIIAQLETNIINELSKKNMNEEKVESLTGIRSEFNKELNSLKRGENIRDMFDTDYWKSYIQPHRYL